MRPLKIGTFGNTKNREERKSTFTMDMREKDIERRLVAEVKKIGGWALKFTSPGQAGVPDRIILLPGRVYFVELKRPGQKPRPLQEAVFRRMRRLYQKVFTVASISDLDYLIEYFKNDLYWRE